MHGRHFGDEIGRRRFDHPGLVALGLVSWHHRCWICSPTDLQDMVLIALGRPLGTTGCRHHCTGCARLGRTVCVVSSYSLSSVNGGSKMVGSRSAGRMGSSSRQAPRYAGGKGTETSRRSTSGPYAMFREKKVKRSSQEGIIRSIGKFD